MNPAIQYISCGRLLASTQELTCLRLCDIDECRKMLSLGDILNEWIVTDGRVHQSSSLATQHLLYEELTLRSTKNSNRDAALSYSARLTNSASDSAARERVSGTAGARTFLSACCCSAPDRYHHTSRHVNRQEGCTSAGCWWPMKMHMFSRYTEEEDRTAERAIAIGAVRRYMR